MATNSKNAILTYAELCAFCFHDSSVLEYTLKQNVNGDIRSITQITLNPFDISEGYLWYINDDNDNINVFYGLEIYFFAETQGNQNNINTYTSQKYFLNYSTKYKIINNYLYLSIAFGSENIKSGYLNIIIVNNVTNSNNVLAKTNSINMQFNTNIMNDMFNEWIESQIGNTLKCGIKFMSILENVA